MAARPLVFSRVGRNLWAYRDVEHGVVDDQDEQGQAEHAKNPPAFATSVWSRPPRSRGGSPALSRDQIVKAALDLLDTEDIDGLSMRRPGAKLGAGATSVYWHVANKDELLDLAIDAVMGEVRLPGDGDDWRTASAAMVRDVRDVLLRHPWIASLFGVRLNIGPHSMALSEAMIRLLVQAGFAQTSMIS